MSSQIRQSEAPWMIMQATRVYKGEDITFDANDLWATQDYQGNNMPAKGAYSKIDATLMVHPIDALDASGDALYVPLEISAGDTIGTCAFDSILETGSTAGLFSVDGNLKVWM